MTKTLVIVGLLLLVAIPAMAQGPFADVPTDHWAYQAVNDLQEKGVLLGYPDGTFQGKRAITRYEFAVAIARMIPVILSMVPPDGGTGVSQADFDALKNRVAILEGRPTGGGPTPTGFCSAEDCANMKRLMDQFRDELAALGVDVDALKRDVAALSERLAAVEKEIQRVKWTGSWDIFGVATRVKSGNPFDRDNRPFQSNGDIRRSIGVIYDGDLNIRGKLSEMTSANATINFGNYLNYVSFLDDYVGTVRPNSKASGLSDDFFPMYLYIDAGFGPGSIEVGRLPLQWTPYTLKKIDIDTYTNILKTDDGNYPVDGIKGEWKFGGVNVTGFATKNNQNTHLLNGLTSQANGGLYQVSGQFNQIGGAAAGGLGSIDQSAGARLMIGTPWKGNLGVSYIRAAGPAVTVGANTYDQADILGGDLNILLGKFAVGADYSQVTTKASVGSDVDSDNAAWDGKIGATFGGLGLNVGYRQVERNFTAPGYWEKIGRWANPSNIRGPYLDASYGLTSSIKLVANGAFYKGAKDIVGLPAVLDQKDDKVWRATAGLKWGFSPNWSVDAGGEYIKWDPNGASAKPKEQYWTIGAAWQINPSAGLKLAYQIIDYNTDGSNVTPYGASYKGNLAVAEFGVKF